ncbi:uncharacterized protein TNCV_4999041 [Trichonephila clavipes]|nr:uncharacterized protein TNCV_4999041 [Trichonephila clavipes]
MTSKTVSIMFGRVFLKLLRKEVAKHIPFPKSDFDCIDEETVLTTSMVELLCNHIQENVSSLFIFYGYEKRDTDFEIMSPRERFRTGVFLPIIGNLVAQLSKRRDCYEVLNTRFEISRNLHEKEPAKPNISLNYHPVDLCNALFTVRVSGAIDLREYHCPMLTIGLYGLPGQECTETEVWRTVCVLVSVEAAAVAPYQCHDVQCIHGVCREGRCVCDQGWQGNGCHRCGGRVNISELPLQGGMEHYRPKKTRD